MVANAPFRRYHVHGDTAFVMCPTGSNGGSEFILRAGAASPEALQLAESPRFALAQATRPAQPRVGTHPVQRWWPGRTFAIEMGARPLT